MGASDWVRASAHNPAAVPNRKVVREDESEVKAGRLAAVRVELAGSVPWQ
jgi:hypothetical protein